MHRTYTKDLQDEHRIKRIHNGNISEEYRIKRIANENVTYKHRIERIYITNKNHETILKRNNRECGFLFSPLNNLFETHYVKK